MTRLNSRSRHGAGDYLLFVCCGLAVLCLWGQPASAQAIVKRRGNVKFTRNDLQIMTARNTLENQREQLKARFRKFVPSTTTHVDTLYACFDTSDAWLQREALNKLCALKKADLIAHSRTYLESKDLRKAKVAIRVVQARKDHEAIPVLRKLVNKREFAKLREFARVTLAQLADPELLKELLDPQRVPEDPTLADYNRKLLQIYGEEGFRQWRKSKMRLGKARRFSTRFIRETRDPETVPDLVELYGETDEDDMKEAVLFALSAINTLDCQTTLRRALKDKALLRRLPSETRMVAMTAIIKYDLAEIRDCRQSLLKILETGRESERRLAAELAPLLVPDKHFEPKLALALAELLPTRFGGTAARSLRKMTGLRFRYAKPFSDSEERKERLLSGKPTAKDLGLTVESVARYKKRQLASLERIRKNLEGDKNLSQDEKKRIYETYRADILGRIKAQEKLLTQKRTPPWEIGIPLGQAKKRIMDYYQLGGHKDEPGRQGTGR